MFDNTKAIYMRPDWTFVITYGGNPYHLTGDETMPIGLWHEVMAFIAANPNAVQPEPDPEATDAEPIPTPEFEAAAEWRKYKYQTLPIIDWKGSEITVDQAVLIHSSYYAEWLAEHDVTEPIPDGHPVRLLSVRIHEAKRKIREMHPDGIAGIASTSTIVEAVGQELVQ
jgi:hypothetical protein